MAKCQVSTHSHAWRIKAKKGDKRTIFCLACEFEWDSESKQYESLPKLTDIEKRKHLVGLYD